MGEGDMEEKKALIRDTVISVPNLTAIEWLIVSTCLSRVLLENRATLQFSKQVCRCRIMAHIHKLAYAVGVAA